MNRIDKLYSTCKSEGKKAFNVYICAGDPDLETTAALIREFERRGVDAIELGVPFSDPVADGPVIQQAAKRAIEAGTTLDAIIRLVAGLRKSGCAIPICLMTYFNPVHHYGVERFVDDAADAGVDGFIIPDLCPEEGEALIARARARDVKTIFFIAPTTTPERMKTINEQSTGFIYCVSVIGITGARKELPPDLRDHLLRVRRLTSLPLVVGFGISNRETVRMMCEMADGVIVGSAICKKIEELLSGPREELVRKAGEFAAELAEGART
ncbi:MAG TPA: tryptophan synthase subunit alpha [Planctomycetota bacterium]|nr:tryptophan synthase subunit alpha [Planctomycetota bacterium]